MKHYLITGGAGFIGSNLIRQLLSKTSDVKITCIDNFDPFYSTAVKKQNIEAFAGDERFRLVVKDIGSTSANDLTAEIQDKIDVIIHLAAKAGVRPSIQNPLAYQQSNVIGLQNLLDFEQCVWSEFSFSMEGR